MNVRKKNPAGTVLTVMLLAALLTICLEMGLSYLRPGIPGSIPKHLIHFAIMFALLGGAVLLCLFCPPFKKLWAWIDEHILSKETRPIAIDIIYAIVAGLMLLHHFYILLYYPIIPSGAAKLAPIWVFFAAFSVLLGKSWREVNFYLVVIFLLFTFERLYIKNLNISNNDFVYFTSAIYSLFICFGVFSTVRQNIWEPFLQILCAIWTFCTVIVSIAGLYTGWTGETIRNLVEHTIYIARGRLCIFSVATVTASVLSSGSIMALVGFTVSKHKLVKILYLFSCLVTMLANSLTDTRASFFMLAFMIAGVLCMGLWTIIRNSKTKKKTEFRTILFVASIILCFGLCFFGIVECQRYLGTHFFETRDNRGILPAANAEEEKATVFAPTPLSSDIKQRDVWASEESDINETLNGRYDIWKKGIQYIQDHPYIIISGVTIDGSVAPIVGREDHSHNILLQTFLEGGIPALLLYLSLVFYGIFHAFRLWNHSGVFWQRALPLPVFAILLWEMAECLTHFSYGHPPMTLFWFFLGATITVSKSLGKAPKTAEQLAIPAESAVTETGE